MSVPQTYPTTVAVVGLGNMGMPMARHLLGAARETGGTLIVHARNRDKVSALLHDGAEWADDPAGLASASVVLSVLPDIPQLEAMLWGDHGIIQAVTAPTVLLIASTSAPSLVRELAARAASESSGLVSVVDCPVSGGVEGAQNAELAIMVGGDAASVSSAMPVLERLGTPVHLGPLGSGQVAKACNQAIVAATVLALGEAAVLADRSGLDVRALFELLGRGYASSRILETRGDRIVDRDYRVAGPARYMVKDLGFALDEARRTDTVLPQTEALLAAFTALVDRGYGDDDIAVTRAFVESLSERPLD
ncbi:NAD(P)-dependent oxidoreductase [Agromyces albus]|uniref:NAD(P)-dependent oxidoreductase n=1 Tax=Agromyces albus TaxID=205332 RepID=A0A4V1QWS2_9MICO|nr:NAD(P)-dependent oxidoreductase [Agromyces albus]RXZ67146.1 NAD(P)-dependent oxidoreductase [Agromyces albus]